MTSNVTSALFDVNVWVALVLQHHNHHHAANQALPKLPAPIVCRVTQSSLLRMLTNASVMGANVCTPAKAWSDFEKMMRDTAATFHVEPAGLEGQWKTYMQAGHAVSANAWSDAYLAAFALCAGVQMVTFDRGFKRFKGLHCHIL